MSSVSSILSKFRYHTGTVLHKVTLDEYKNQKPLKSPSQRFKSAAKSITSGILDGISGIVKDPIKVKQSIEVDV